MLPGHPGALQCGFRLCKSIFMCSWKQLQQCRCIQDAIGLTSRIVKLWSWCELCTSLQEMLRAAETLPQVCRRFREQLRPLCKCCGRLGAIFSQQWFLGSNDHKAFCLSYSSLWQIQDCEEEGRWGGAWPSSRLARRPGGYHILSFSSESEDCMNKRPQSQDLLHHNMACID